MRTKNLITTALFLFCLSTAYSQDTAFINVCLSDTIYFDSDLEYYSTYQWNFDDGNFSYDEKPFHKYSQAGTYDATVTAFDACCPNADTVASYHITVNGNPNCLGESDSIFVVPNPVNNLMYVTYYLGNSNGNNSNFQLRVIEISTGLVKKLLALSPNDLSVLVDSSDLLTGYYSVALLVNSTVSVQQTIFKN